MRIVFWMVMSSVAVGDCVFLWMIADMLLMLKGVPPCAPMAGGFC